MALRTVADLAVGDLAAVESDDEADNPDYRHYDGGPYVIDGRIWWQSERVA